MVENKWFIVCQEEDADLTEAFKASIGMLSGEGNMGVEEIVWRMDEVSISSYILIRCIVFICFVVHTNCIVFFCPSKLLFKGILQVQNNNIPLK